MKIFRKTIALIGVSSQFHVEVGLVDQVLEEVDSVPPEVADAVLFKGQEGQVCWQGYVVDLAELVMGEVQMFNVVEGGEVPICIDLCDLVS